MPSMGQHKEKPESEEDCPDDSSYGGVGSSGFYERDLGEKLGWENVTLVPQGAKAATGKKRRARRNKVTCKAVGWTKRGVLTGGHKAAKKIPFVCHVGSKPWGLRVKPKTQDR